MTRAITPLAEARPIRPPAVVGRKPGRTAAAVVTPSVAAVIVVVVAAVAVVTGAAVVPAGGGAWVKLVAAVAVVRVDGIVIATVIIEAPSLRRRVAHGLQVIPKVKCGVGWMEERG